MIQLMMLALDQTDGQLKVATNLNFLIPFLDTVPETRAIMADALQRCANQCREGVFPFAAKDMPKPDLIVRACATCGEELELCLCEEKVKNAGLIHLT